MRSRDCLRPMAPVRGTFSIWVTACRSTAPPDHVAALVNAVHTLSRRFH